MRNQVDVALHDAVHVACAVGQGLDCVAVGAVRVNLHNLQEYEQIRQLARLDPSSFQLLLTGLGICRATEGGRYRIKRDRAMDKLFLYYGTPTFLRTFGVGNATTSWIIQPFLKMLWCA
jgi:hypothetical protein